MADGSRPSVLQVESLARASGLEVRGRWFAAFIAVLDAKRIRHRDLIVAVSTERLLFFERHRFPRRRPPQTAPAPVYEVSLGPLQQTSWRRRLRNIELTVPHDGTTLNLDFVTVKEAEAFESRLNLLSQGRPLVIAGEAGPPLPANAIAVVVLGSHGFALEEASELLLVLQEASFELVDYWGETVCSVPYRQLAEATVGGPGEVTSGGGFVGGGFGVEGFLMGAAAAAILNRLTERSDIHTLLRLSTFDGEVNLFTSAVTPEELDLRLAPARSTIRSSARPNAAAASLAEQLTRLAELHETGALTDEEFAAAKRRVLADQ